MANKNDYRDLSQVDYCLKQYYSKYMAPVLIKERTDILRKQHHDTLKLNETQQQLPNFGAASSSFTNLSISEKHNRKSLDELVTRTTSIWLKDAKLQHDYSMFVSSFYQLLVAKNGGKESQDLLDYADNYCTMRFQKLMIEQLAREKVPKGTAEYIAKKAFSESMLGLFDFGKLSGGQYGDAVNEKAESLYNPSKASRIAGSLGGAAIDVAILPGFGKGASSVGKAIIKGGKKAVGYGATDIVLRQGLSKAGKIWGKDEEKDANRKFFGDENASQKIAEGSNKYRKSGTELISIINSNLRQKIKVPPLGMSEKTRKEANIFYANNDGSAKKLLSSIKGSFSKQAISINDNSKVPAWMLSYGSKTNQGYAAKFHAIAMEMSRNGKGSLKVGGKMMTLKEVAQRAYDYARAAAIVEQKQTLSPRKSVLYKNETNKARKSFSKETATPYNTSTDMPSSPYYQTYQASQPQSSPLQSPQGAALNPTQNSGWGKALEERGKNGFSDIFRNLGYVLAMLPDMIIGMFTGKTPNLKLQDNLMPLAAIMGGMFAKNPLLKMMLMGFGGANILNNAGHAAINEGLARNKAVTTYKSYENEALSPRIQNPAMKGCSLIATIDGVPCVINISEDAAVAYAKGAIPLNTLANAVLRKYDENHALASQKYEQHVNQEEEQSLHLGIK